MIRRLFLIFALLASLPTYSIREVSAQGQPPAAPSNLEATVVSDTEILLTWTDNSNNETGFNIYLAGFGSFIATVGPDTTSFTVGNLSPDIIYDYCFSITAYDDWGNSSISNTACANTSSASPVADFEAFPLSGDAPLLVEIHNISTGDYTSCIWDYGDGTTGDTCAAYHDHTYSAGSYKVALTVSGPGGSDTKNISNYINVSSITYSIISGRVTDTNDNPIFDVLISKSYGETTSTDMNGYYSFSDQAPGIYTITPSKNGYTFSTSYLIAIVPPSVTTINFKGTFTQVPTTTLSRTPTQIVVPTATLTTTRTLLPLETFTPTITPSRTPTLFIAASPSHTASRTPTATTTPRSPGNLPAFNIIDVQTKPSSINQFERTYLRIKVSSGDAKLPANYWSNFSFSGEVVLKSSDGRPVTNPISFIDHENAYWLPTTVYDEKLGVTKLNLGEIQVTANLNFNKAVQDGIMEVFIYTNDKPRQTLVYSLPINVANQDLKIVDCASVIADKISVAWPGLSAAKKLIALNRFRAEITNCDNLSCASKKLREYVWELIVEGEAKKLGIEEAGELLVATRDAVYGQDSLELCRKPALWLYSIIGEYIRSGIPINMRAVHSPALLMLTNPIGEHVGFLAKNNSVTEINGSIAFINEDSQFVYFPAQNVTTQLTGIGEGFMTVEAIDIREGRMIETTFIDVPVSSETIAYVNTIISGSEISLINGGKSQTIQADYEVVQEVQQSKRSIQPGGGLGLGMVFVLLAVGGVSILVFRNRAKGRVSSSNIPRQAGLVGAGGSRTDLTLTDFVIGRGGNCNLRLPDRAVSRQHARIRYAQGQWFVQDMGSKSGTYVNGMRVDATALKDGDRIRIGSAEFVFKM